MSDMDSANPNTAQWFPVADHLVVLTEHGTVASAGSFEALRYSDKYISSLETSHIQVKAVKHSNKFSETSVAADSSEQRNEDIFEKHQLDRKVSIVVSTHEHTEGRGKMTSSLPYYVKSLASFSFAFYCLTFLLQTACHVIQPLWLSFWTAANARNPTENPGKWVGVYVMFSALNLGGLSMEYLYVIC
jgi:hypothetical protein